MTGAGSMGRWIVGSVALAVCLVLALGLFAWTDYRRFLEVPLQIPDEGVIFEVREGDNPTTALGRLEALGLTEVDWRWRLLLRLDPATIRAGEYRLSPGMRPHDLLQHLGSNDVVQYRFTIVEGWTYGQLASALQAQPDLAVEPSLLGPDRIMTLIGSDVGHPEGWFLPETYAWVRGDDALDLLRRAHMAMREALQEAWKSRADDLPLAEPYDLLTLASIVEKESGLAAERPAIAGVFIRRLQQGWRLETDPTVIYGLGDAFDGDIRSRDLRQDTPYNTYTRHGLPPTPIAMPGPSSLNAAAHPATGSAMFFVADGAGGHVFSDTLEEHNRAVQAFLRQREKNP
jgi:UPF0755 protein